MYLLFLDTETSGLDPVSGQIIEVAGVLADFNPVDFSVKIIDQFQSLVQNRSNLDPKITRLTGITEEELVVSQSMGKVQQQWLDWLEKYEDKTVAVIGHSVAFDMKFLNAEGWYVPKDAKEIDTLALSKILLSNYSALNLEYLIEKLSLLDFLKQSLTDFDETQKAHRALYDTQCCLSLFNILLDKLKLYNFSTEFYTKLKDTVLPLDITFFPGKKGLNKFEERSAKNTKINFIGEVISGDLQSRFNYNISKDVSKMTQNLQSYFAIINKENAVVILSMYAACFIKDKDVLVRINTYTAIEKAVFELLTDSSNFSDSDHKAEIVSLDKRFEEIIWRIEPFANYELNFTKLTAWLQLLISIEDEKSSIVKQSNKILSATEFLLYSTQAFLYMGEYKYKPLQMNPEEKIVVSKFTSWMKEVVAFLEIANPKDYDGVAKSILLKVTKFFSDYIADGMSPNQFCTFRVYQNLAKILRPKHFDVKENFSKLSDKYKEVNIYTYLAEDDFAHLLKLLGNVELPNNIKVEYRGKEGFVDDNSSNLNELIAEKSKLAKTNQKPVLLLLGQNKTLRQIQNICVEDLKDNEYLVLGESGSLTKVASKLVRNFVGVVAVKVGDFGYLQHINNLPEFTEIWIVNLPYIKLDNYWFKMWPGKAGRVAGELRILYTQSWSRLIHSVTGKQVRFSG